MLNDRRQQHLQLGQLSMATHCTATLSAHMGCKNCSLGLPGAHLLTNFNKRGKLLPVSTYLLKYLLINVSTRARANSAG